MFTERCVEVGKGVALRVLVRDGSVGAVPFLLVHGLASNAHLWDGVGEALSELGHPSAAIDLRGHGPFGRSQALDNASFAFDNVAADIVTVTQSLGWDRPVAAGQSWGGNVVVELAARHPDAVRGIVCIDGGTIELANYFDDFDACAEILQPPHLEGASRSAIEQFLRSAHPDWPETGIAGQLANFEARADGTIAPWLTRPRHMAILRGLYEHHPSGRWRSLGRTPVMFVPAVNDSSPFDKTREISAAERVLARSRVHTMQGDHDLHAQYPAEVAQLLHAACTDGFFA